MNSILYNNILDILINIISSHLTVFGIKYINKIICFLKTVCSLIFQTKIKRLVSLFYINIF
jgi:hypothetical protein